MIVRRNLTARNPTKKEKNTAVSLVFASSENRTPVDIYQLKMHIYRYFTFRSFQNFDINMHCLWNLLEITKNKKISVSFFLAGSLYSNETEMRTKDRKSSKANQNDPKSERPRLYKQLVKTSPATQIVLPLERCLYGVSCVMCGAWLYRFLAPRLYIFLCST